MRLYGLNLARILGDKFLKQQDFHFSSEPYISEVVYIHQASKGFVLLASDGFWDVTNAKKVVQVVQQAKERGSTDEISAEKIANSLLSEARTLPTGWISCYQLKKRCLLTIQIVSKLLTSRARKSICSSLLINSY